MLIITISRQTGGLGEELARKVSEVFGLQLIDREFAQSKWLSEIASKAEINILKNSPKAHLNQTHNGVPIYKHIEQKLIEATCENGAVIVGLGSQVIFATEPNSFHIRVVAPETVRIARICSRYGIDETKAKMFIALSDRKRRRYLSQVYSKDWEDTNLYSATFNTDKVSVDQIIEILKSIFPNMVKENEFDLSLETLRNQNSNNKAMVHKSEEDFGKILNMYNIDWKYEPTTFPIEWDAEGNVTMAFTPDFYLPTYKTYIELTTMNQKYVTKKNKKLRKLRTLYPDVNITILYKKDINKLLKKFGVI